ncbi:MAG: 1-deoxy-D-xylulose-5-phosphate synthase [Flavobacteriales bacterium]|nr:1-deoxy-D-xylulose-5-phosphate synthase [Flavobacteriales bacterium]
MKQVENDYKEKYPLLSSIDAPLDLKVLSMEELLLLSTEIRNYIIDVVSVQQGHLGSNLGVVELTIALHYVFDTPREPLVWDVGHQAYAHKILTGRRDLFPHLREKGGISGFPRIKESVYDSFGTGHSSTSISAALGMAIASIDKDPRRTHIAVIGDASIASGMAWEAINHAGTTSANLLIVLNDNAMGIDPATGALSRHLIALSQNSTSGNIYKELGIEYRLLKDGHDLPALIETLKEIKDTPGVKILHTITTKGKGYPAAEEEQILYHYPGTFDRKTGHISHTVPTRYQDVVGSKLLGLALEDDKVYALTPAMPTSSGLAQMMQTLPHRVINTGIAESHTITLAAGMTVGGLKPFAVVYSTFLQRAYDQIVHDIALQNLPVRMMIDRAGLVGADGATHHGIFDVSYLLPLPNVTICSPMDEEELMGAVDFAYRWDKGPIAVRYPRGDARKDRGEHMMWEIGKGRVLRGGSDICVISSGEIGLEVERAIEMLDDEEKKYVSHYDLRFIKPMDIELLTRAFCEHRFIITVEENTLCGGVGSQIALWGMENGHSDVKVERMGIKDFFPQCGTISQLRMDCGIDVHSIIDRIRVYISYICNENKLN